MGKSSKQWSRAGKSKAGSKRSATTGHQSSVFKVTGVKALKAKNKTKAVTKNLKKLNFQTRSEVSRNDAKFQELQSQLETGNRKRAATETVKTQRQEANKSVQAERPPVDMDTAAKQFSLL
ncbi:ribosomal biogenesis factor-like [Ptychodera flava]|uniref:ribosomal biogenesis factor-like n=1 Tax=Ptychodera flava TaxID=63121 RepID=UPI00396A5960